MKFSYRYRKIISLVVLSALMVTMSVTPAVAEYNPKTGRFLQPDPNGTGLIVSPGLRYHGSNPVVTVSMAYELQYGDGMNFYEYLKSNVINRTDPTGLFSFGFDYFLEGEEMMLSIVGTRAANLAALKKQIGQTIDVGKTIGTGLLSFVPGGEIALLLARYTTQGLSTEDFLVAGASVFGGAALWKGGQLIARAFSKFRRSSRTLRGAGNVAVDANLLIRGLDGGELQAVERALSGRAPIVSITAAKEYLRRGNKDVLRRFLQARGGRIGLAGTHDQVENLVQQAKILGRSLKRADANVAGSALREGVPLLTRDKRLARFLEAVGLPVEGF